jgi:hypothetical protein
MPLLIFILAVPWLMASLWIASRVAKLVKPWWLRLAIFIVVAPALVALPALDELIGAFQFERYCENAQDVKIYGTLPTGQELYTPEAKWRVGNSGPESKRLNEIYDALVEWDWGMPDQVPGAIPIYHRTTKVFDRKKHRLLAQFDSYSTPGGWLHGETPAFVRPACQPSLVTTGELNRKILPYDPNVGAAK